jgi:hypothetical protein
MEGYRDMTAAESKASYQRAQAQRDRQDEPKPDDEEERLQRQLDEADRKLDIEREDEI